MKLADDHLNLLALARRAIEAESGPMWKRDVEEAMENHSACCNDLWDELRRQVEVSEGKIPTLDHPTVKQRKMAARMKREIIAACNGAIESALEDLWFES